uniref:Charged multivesicular body protein 5 n=1 Tax=Mantoniella antarctica TaxID=81844 RepID=A0A7S0XDS1_9CHLO|mmetsp:Transcript_43632/g.70171  ORF Transcript_43632/g.70171 Transcript_43632/m.70171 type:complete len:233 (-) Transcript_43632:467-1165(-)
MKRLFGVKKEKPPAPSLDDATGSLEKRGDGVDEKIKKLDAELAKHRDIIKKARPGPAQDAAKRRALQVLKQKRLYEGQRETLYNQQFNLEQVSFAAQSAKDTVVQVQAMQAASKELKTQFKSKTFNIDAIDALNDEMADLMDYSADIQETLGRSYNVPDDIDEDELLGELDALEADMALEEVGEEVPSYLQDEALPDAPDGVVEPLPAVGTGGVPAEVVPASTVPAQRNAAS